MDMENSRRYKKVPNWLNSSEKSLVTNFNINVKQYINDAEEIKQIITTKS